MQYHFIRGYFDGDGCFTWYFNTKYINCKFEIIGTNDFCKEIFNILKIVPTITNLNKNLVRASNGKKKNIEYIYEYLYKDATIFLKRKQEKFLKWKLEHEKRKLNNNVS